MTDLTDLLRQYGAGIATVPSEALRVAGIIANPNRFVRQIQGTDTEEDRSRYGGVAQVLQGSGDAWNALVNRTAGVEDPSVLDNTAEAVARFAGGAAFTAPVRALSAIGAGLPTAARVAAAIPLKAAELLTPITFTNATTQVGKMGGRLANVGVQTAASGALEYALENRDPTVPHAEYDMQGNLLSQSTPMPDQTPGAGRIVAREVGSVINDHPVAAGLTTAGLVAAGLLARRSMRQGAAQRIEAGTSPIVKPADRLDTDVPIIDQSTVRGDVRNAANRTAEVFQDANIRTKDAVKQADPDPERARATRDAIDMVQEPAHKDRVISVAENGRIVTPRGTIQTESLSRIFSDLFHQSIDKPELNKATKELLVLETEADNRAYAMAKGQKDSYLIDTATGLKPEIGTPQSRMMYVTPRATLHAVSDSELARRIVNIRRDMPDAARYAERYWKLHRDLADAWVNFGLVSKSERAQWGRANPQFMHTINLDDAKSPRTYRIREHGSGPATGGDPLLAATEYIDFMLGHVYRNRMRQQVVTSLRAGAAANPGQFGNGKWIGRVAHPEEIRRRQVIDPRTGQLRAMNKDDLDMKGDRISYYDNGELVDVEIRNPQLLHTLQTMPTAGSTIMGYFRQLAQSGMTGKLATLTGQPFVLGNASMGFLFGAVTRPAGRAFGYADQAAQWGTRKLFGKAIGIRADPTIIPGMLNAGIRDVASILTRTLAQSIHNSIAADGLMSKIPGAQRVADTASRKYVDSLYAANHRIGSGSASTLGDRDFDTAANRASVVSTVTPHGNTARIISDPKDWKEEIQLLGQRAVPAELKIAARMFGDINDAVGNMAQSLLFRQGYGKVKKLDDAARVPEVAYASHMAQAQPFFDQATALKQQAQQARQAGNHPLARQLNQQASVQKGIGDQYVAAAKPYEAAAARARETWFREYNGLGVATRQLLGDSGMRGTGLRDLGKPGTTATEKVAGLLMDATPYGNIGMQALGRLIQAAKENPGGTAAAVGMLVGPMAILPIWNAVRLDKARAERGEPPLYVPYELSRPSWDGSRFVLGAMDGTDPDHSPRFRIDPAMSLPYTIIREAAIEIFGLNRSPSDPARAYSAQQLERIVNDRIFANVRTAAYNAQPISQFPPVIGAGAAAVGVDLGSFSDLMTRGSASPLPSRGMGGYDQTRLANDTTTKTFDAVIGQLFGGAGMTWVGMVRSGWQSEQRTPASFAGAAFDEFKGRAQDRLPEFQPLFDQPSRRATSDTVANLVNSKEQAIRLISENRTSLQAGGTVGGGRFRSNAPDGGRAGVDDPIMRQVFGTVMQFNTATEEFRQARTRIRENMLDIEQRALPYADRRIALNEQSREISRLNTVLLARYVRFEDELSQRLGLRIRIDEIDPSKPASQFRPLNPSPTP